MSARLSAPRPAAGFTRRCVLAGLLACALVPCASSADEAPMAEYQIKAAFLCKFGNYVAWPGTATPTEANRERPFWIGVAATDAVSQMVRNAAAGQRVDGRPIAVRQLGRNDSVDGLDLVFVARSHGGRANDLLLASKGQPIVTVTESDPGTDARGMINFVVIDDKVKFDIQLPVVEASQLRISARLLSIAHSVTGRPS